VLMRLLWEEHSGNCAGLTPTGLSHNQHVSRNTVSALLRGLEDQGLIVRKLDPDDRRVFRIALTETGRRIAQDMAPRNVDHLNSLISQLSQSDQSHLIILLSKLYQSLLDLQPVETRE
jgi:DNA-binding MarR family transcriptional regulator